MSEEKSKFEKKRGFKGSITFAGKKLQVLCPCNDNFSRQLRKQKTQPLDIRAIQEAHRPCKQCGQIPHIIVPARKAAGLFFHWQNTP